MTEPQHLSSAPSRARVLRILLDRICESDIALIGLEIAEAASLDSLVPARERLRRIVGDVKHELGRSDESGTFELRSADTLGQLADQLVQA